MRRKYIGVGLMAALVFSAAPLSGTAGGEEHAFAVPAGPIDQQKCAVVNDAGNGKVTVKKNKNDAGTTVQLASGDTLVVCLNVKADVAAKAQLTVVADVKAGEGVQCNDGGGTGFAVDVAADVAVEPGFQADAELTATVHANAAVDGTGHAQTVTTGNVAYGVGNNANDGIAPELGAEADYCKTVDLADPAR